MKAGDVFPALGHRDLEGLLLRIFLYVNEDMDLRSFRSVSRGWRNFIDQFIIGQEKQCEAFNERRTKPRRVVPTRQHTWDKILTTSDLVVGVHISKSFGNRTVILEVCRIVAYGHYEHLGVIKNPKFSAHSDNPIFEVEMLGDRIFVAHICQAHGFTIKAYEQHERCWRVASHPGLPVSGKKTEFIGMRKLSPTRLYLMTQGSSLLDSTYLSVTDLITGGTNTIHFSKLSFMQSLWSLILPYPSSFELVSPYRYDIDESGLVIVWLDNRIYHISFNPLRQTWSSIRHVSHNMDCGFTVINPMSKLSAIHKAKTFSVVCSENNSPPHTTAFFVLNNAAGTFMFNALCVWTVRIFDETLVYFTPEGELFVWNAQNKSTRKLTLYDCQRHLAARPLLSAMLDDDAARQAFQPDARSLVGNRYLLLSVACKGFQKEELLVWIDLLHPERRVSQKIYTRKGHYLPFGSLTKGNAAFFVLALGSGRGSITLCPPY